jgi:hypothetical protein
LFRVCQAVGATTHISDRGSRDALDGLELPRRLDARELQVSECNSPSAANCRANLAASGLGPRVAVNELAVAEYDAHTSVVAIDTTRTEMRFPDRNLGVFSLLRATDGYT